MYGWRCKCGVTRLPTYDHSVHVWKRRKGIVMSVRLLFFLHVFQKLLSLSKLLEQDSDESHRTRLETPDHVVLDNPRNKGLCPLSLLFLSLIFHTDCVGELLL